MPRAAHRRPDPRHGAGPAQPGHRLVQPGAFGIGPEQDGKVARRTDPERFRAGRGPKPFAAAIMVHDRQRPHRRDARVIEHGRSARRSKNNGSTTTAMAASNRNPETWKLSARVNPVLPRHEQTVPANNAASGSDRRTPATLALADQQQHVATRRQATPRSAPPARARCPARRRSRWRGNNRPSIETSRAGRSTDRRAVARRSTTRRRKSTRRHASRSHGVAPARRSAPAAPALAREHAAEHGDGEHEEIRLHQEPPPPPAPAPR